jgi:hypothetical protein
MKRKIIVYPFIVGISPILILFANNLGEVEFSDVWRSLLAATLLAALLLLIGWFVFRNWGKAGLLASVMTISILAYGYIYDGLKTVELFVPFTRHRFLLSILVLFILLFGWLLWKKTKNTGPLELFFAWFSIFLLIFPLYKIASYYLFSSVHGANAIPQNESIVVPNQAKPDVYYIILDGYGREDTLKKFYKFDNSEFINELTKLGFYVAPDATSNYPQTLLSLGSSLNYQYIDNTLLRVDPSSNDRRELTDRVLHSRVRQIFHDAGYTFVAFDTGYTTSVQDADIYYQYRGPQNQGQSLFLSMNSFEGLLFEQSIVRPLIDFGVINQKSLASTLEAPYIRHGGRILFAFDKLTQIPNMDGDYFVFAHIIAPHPPFVFGKNGEFISHTTAYKLGDTTKYAGTREEYIRDYTNEMTYVNSLVLRTVKAILSESKTPPIIIIQGDHGPGAYLNWASEKNTNMQDRFSMLNAYYLQGKKSTLLYPSISPVNSFRVVLDEVFGMNLELLPDRSYFSLWLTPFKFIDVSSEVKQGQ